MSAPQEVTGSETVARPEAVI
ncbi:MAG: hypothetical protein QOH17_2626, partial [Pseudonocardiales bacterium]|nr:hypothetical protein [Pseudonocardiales bacterium]